MTATRHIMFVTKNVCFFALVVVLLHTSYGAILGQQANVACQADPPDFVTLTCPTGVIHVHLVEYRAQDAACGVEADPQCTVYRDAGSISNCSSQSTCILPLTWDVLRHVVCNLSEEVFSAASVFYSCVNCTDNVTSDLCARNTYGNLSTTSPKVPAHNGRALVVVASVMIALVVLALLAIIVWQRRRYTRQYNTTKMDGQATYRSLKQGNNEYLTTVMDPAARDSEYLYPVQLDQTTKMAAGEVKGGATADDTPGRPGGEYWNMAPDNKQVTQDIPGTLPGPSRYINITEVRGPDKPKVPKVDTDGEELTEDNYYEEVNVRKT